MPTYLAVPYNERNIAKALGAQWDAKVKRWYAPNNENVLIKKWPVNNEPVTELIGEERGFAGNKLFVDLIPQSCWFTNVRSCVDPSDWDRLRHFVYERANNRCECCNAPGPLDAHERWHFDDTNKVQKLMRIMVLCKACHEATHMGFARFRGREEIATAHLMQVTDMTELSAHEHIEQAFNVWQYRNGYYWDLDLTIITDSGIKLIKQFNKYERDKESQTQLQVQKNSKFKTQKATKILLSLIGLMAIVVTVQFLMKSHS